MGRPQRIEVEHAHHAVKSRANLRARHLPLFHKARQAHQRRIRQGFVFLRGALLVPQNGADGRLAHGGFRVQFEIEQAAQRFVLRRGGQFGQQTEHRFFRASGQSARRAADMRKRAPR